MCPELYPYPIDTNVERKAQLELHGRRNFESVVILDEGYNAHHLKPNK